MGNSGEEKQMLETIKLLPEDRQRELLKIEEELLLTTGTTKGQCNKSLHLGCTTNSAAFLLGYLMLSAGANVWMATEYDVGAASTYYWVNSIFSVVGLFGVTLLNPTILFIYGGYLCASFLFSAAISGGAILFVLQSNVCEVMKSIIPNDAVNQFCIASPGRFQAISVLTILAELGLELFVMLQLSHLYDYTLRRRPDDDDDDGEKREKRMLPKGTLGSITIVQP